MKTIYLNEDNLAYWQNHAEQNVVALGFFDGIHRGHCQVIHTAGQIAKAKGLSLSVMSFFPHPKTVISKEKKSINYLMPLSKKEEELRKLGVDTFYIVEFSKKFASLQPRQFVTDYLVRLGVIHAVAGFDYSYGLKGTGHMKRLKDDSGGKIDVTIIEKCEIDGEKISSTIIREKLINGSVDEIVPLLGRAYELECEWNGERLKPLPYYTLPGPGIYNVTIKNKSKSVNTLLSVMETGNRLSLHCLTNIPKHLKGKLTIAWHHPIHYVPARALATC